MTKRKDDEEEEYEEDDEEEYEEDDEEEEESGSILDDLNKGADFLLKLKELGKSEVPPKPRINYPSMRIASDINRQLREGEIEKKKQEKDSIKEKQERKKWKVELILKVTVPIVVAIIGGLVYLSTVQP